MNAIVNVSLYLAYFLVFLAVAGAIFLPIIKLVEAAPKELIKLGVGLGGILSLFAISYLISSDTGQACGCSRLVGSLLIMAYGLGILSFLGILYLSVSKYFK